MPRTLARLMRTADYVAAPPGSLYWRTHARLARGLCAGCGKRPHRPQRQKCVVCAARDHLRDQDRRRSGRHLPGPRRTR